MVDNNDDDVVPSKLVLLPGYKKEYERNKQILELAIGVSTKIYFGMLASDTLGNVKITNTLLKNSFNEFYIAYRIKDVLVSVTDDLIRYAMYHKIKKECEDYSIAEPIRAAIFTKWILKLRPSIFDSRLGNNFSYSSADEESSSFVNRKIHRVEFCNEHLALLVTSIILDIKYKDTDETIGYDTLFSQSELSTLFYSLRYRLTHQDAFGELYRKVFNFYDDPSNQISKK